MRRRRPQLSVFNMSMLDVLASALGAFLLLFLIMARQADDARADAKAKDEQIEDLVSAVQAAQEALQAAQDAAAAAQAQAQASAAQAEALKKQKDALEAAQRGMAIGMCDVSTSTVRASVRDHSSEDGDLAKLLLNKRVVAERVSLTNQPRTFTLELPVGTSYFVAEALSLGSSPPNTAQVVINPCRDGKPQAFTWDIDTVGGRRNISIVRR